MPQMTEEEVADDLWTVLDRVQAGETIEVLRGGVPVASFQPIENAFLPIERTAEIFRDARP